MLLINFVLIAHIKYSAGLVPSFDTCLTPLLMQGQCVPPSNCPPVFQRLSAPLLPHIQQQCGLQAGQPLVCCPKPVPSSPAPLPSPGDCGVQSVERIYGGTRAKIGEFPWLGLLEYRTSSNRSVYLCGATLISVRVALTAAHCIASSALPASWRVVAVRLGDWNLAEERDCLDPEAGRGCAPPPVDAPIGKIVVHERYEAKKRNQANDIALLMLESEVKFNEWIRPICLPQDSTRDFEREMFMVAGWGRTERMEFSEVKSKLLVPGVAKEECQRVYSGERVQLEVSQLCAGGEADRDSCRGDSGSALMGVDEHDLERPFWYLAGIVSFGANPCGQLGWPAVYTKVSYFIPWILGNI